MVSPPLTSRPGMPSLLLSFAPCPLFSDRPNDTLKSPLFKPQNLQCKVADAGTGHTGFCNRAWQWGSRFQEQLDYGVQRMRSGPGVSISWLCSQINFPLWLRHISSVLRCKASGKRKSISVPTQVYSLSSIWKHRFAARGFLGAEDT